MVKQTRKLEVRSQESEGLNGRGLWLLLFLLTPGSWLLTPAFAQQPQAQAGQPLYAVNAKYVQGVGPGYWPTAGALLTLNLSSGTAICNNVIQTYAGGTLNMAASATNYVYLDGGNNCAPASNTTGFTSTAIPLAQVVTNATAITSITDVRTMFTTRSSGGGGSGGLTSVAMNGDGVIYNISVPGSPITSSGTLAPQLRTQTANSFLAGPSSGSAAAPTFRAITGADLPNISIAGGGTGQTTAAAAFNALSPLTTEGDIPYFHSSTNVRLGVGTNGQCLTSNGTDPVWGSCASGSISQIQFDALPADAGAILITSGYAMVPLGSQSGAGTTLNPWLVQFNVAQATTSTPGAIVLGGDLGGTYSSQSVTALHFGSAQQTLSSTAPASGQCLQYNGTNIVGGSCGTGSGAVSSVALSMPGIFTVSGSPVSGSGTLTAALATQSANTVFAGPASGSALVPTFRPLAGADLPNPSSTTLGGIMSVTCGTGQFINTISTSGGASCATASGGSGNNYGLGNGTTVIDASLYSGSDFAAKVNAAIAALPAGGGTVDARGLGGTQTMGSTIVLGSDSQPVVLILPKGTINRAAGAQFKFFTGSQVIGQGKCFNSPYCTMIQGSQANDTAFTYGGTSSASYVYLSNFVTLSTLYGGPATGVAIDFSQTTSSRVDSVFAYAEVALVVGGAAGSCECYNTFYSDSFRGGMDSSGIGVQLLAGANSNYFYGGDDWGYRGVYHGGWGNYFYGPDIENNTIGFDDAGGGLQIYGGYWEAVGTGVVLEPGTDGAYISGGFPGISVADNSGNSSNFYFNPGAEQQGITALLPLRFGLQDMLLFGSDSLSGYDAGYAIRGDRGGTWGVENLFMPAANRQGFNGHAPYFFGFGKDSGGFLGKGATTFQQLGPPNPPSLAVVGTPGTATCTYYVVGHDWNGGVTLPSSAATITNCPNTLSGTNYVTITPSGSDDGFNSYDYLKGDTAHSLATSTRGSVSDTGQATVAYAAPARDNTGDLSVGGVIASYNGMGTVANGVPVIIAKADQTAFQANVPTTTLYTTPGNGSGMYRASCYIVITQAASISSTLPACQLTWTSMDFTSWSVSAPWTGTTTSNAVGQWGGSASQLPPGGIITVAGNTPISYSTSGYASSGTTPMQFAVHLKLEYLGN